MKTTAGSALLGAGVALAIVLGVAHADQVSTVPRLGSGSVTVEGDVSVKGDVRVVSDVAARQSGPWKVGVDGVVVTTPTAVPFVRIGHTYLVTWPDQSSQTFVARETYGSWVRVDAAGGGQTRQRWVNLSAALSIEERSS